MKRSIGAAVAVFFLAGHAAQAQTPGRDYRCIIDTQSPADRKAAVAAFADTFTRTAASAKSETQSSKESKAAEASMIKLSEACTLKYHWTTSRRLDVEVYTNDYIIQLAGIQALAPKGVSAQSLQRIWRQLTPTDLSALEKMPNDQTFRAREQALLKAEKAPQGSVVEDLVLLYLHFRHDQDLQEAGLVKP